MIGEMWAIFWQTHFEFRFPTLILSTSVQNFDTKNMKSYKYVIENLTNIIKESLKDNRKTLRDTAAPSVWGQEVFVRDVLMIYF